MESQPPDQPTSANAALRSTTTYVAALRIPLAIAILVAVVYAAYYFLYVTSERDYLTGRNFRLLATMGEQIDATIKTDENILNHLVDVALDDNQSLKQVFESPLTAEFIPILRNARSSFLMDVSPRAVRTILAERDAQNTQLATNDDADDKPVIRTSFAERDSRYTWVANDDNLRRKPVVANVRLELDDLLKPFLAGDLQTSIFDAVILAAHDGRVIFQAGSPRLRLTSLANLQVAKTATSLDFAQAARSSSMVGVHLGGSGYKVQIQPCCGRMIRENAPNDREGWVLVGLTEDRAMTAASAAVPFSTMAMLMALLLAALFSWPFLKLSFIGEAQRVRAQDVVLVGLGGLLGIALVTVVALDLYAYGRLETQLDNQLRHFAASVARQANEEIAFALQELQRLESDVLPQFATKPVVKNLAKHLADEGAALRPYPFFESLAALDKDGKQRTKLALASFATPLIDAGSRDYFKYWKAERADTRAFLQPLVSQTTGSREAVLSMKRGGPGTPWSEATGVATLTIPMQSLIDPAMVPGFGFAVIDDDGRVLFHSDPRHNLSEDFFVEADRSRRLKALVAARHQEWVDIKYWGEDHRAFVTPLALLDGDPNTPRPIALVGEPWTLITFYDKDVARTVNVEWLVIVVVLLVAYAGAYVAIALGVLFVRPKYRAPWLWPDPTRSRAYLDALPPLVVLTATFGAAIVALSATEAIAAAALLPFLSWIAAYHALSPRAIAGKWTWTVTIGAGLAALLVAALAWLELPGWRGALVALAGFIAAMSLTTIRRRRVHGASPMALPVNVSYGLAAGLLLMLVAAMPAAAFFKVAHDTVIESFIKYGQLQIALDRSDFENRASDIVARRITDPDTATRLRALQRFPRWWGGYDTFFFCTHYAGQYFYAEDQPACAASGAGGGDTAATDAESVPEMLEELLPFYSESSVWFRELVHDRAADNRWSWSRAGSNLVLHAGPHQALEFVSVKPRFVDWPLRDLSLLWNVAMLAVAAIAVMGAILWVARFVLRSVFVVDLIEPLWSGGAAPVVSGGSPEAGNQATPENAYAAAILSGWQTAGWREVAWRLNALGFAHNASFLDAERRDSVIGGLWKDVLPYAWLPDRPALDVKQLMIEVGERAEEHYREIWAKCSPAEKLVLGQVADEGLVNEKTTHTVRGLMARGLVRRQPQFTLMNETFRQFVLSAPMQTEVHALEDQSTGAWDVMRWPFLIVLVASLGFFFATQQEMFKTVLGALTAAATLVPAVVKMATSIGERRTSA